MAKMFYSTEEAAAKLNVSADQLKQYVSQNKLREFRDGARVMFKVDQVDRLASEATSAAEGGASGDSSIELAPADSGTHDTISLADTDINRAPSKEDTVVTGAAPAASASATGIPMAGASATGIPLSGASATGVPAAGGSATGVPAEKAKVFDDNEVKAADNQAQTQIQPAVEDQLSLEGVGSGSGLLDLTRESDDTSLGAELLDEIYPGNEQKQEGGIGSASGIFEQPVSPEGSSLGGAAIETAQPATPSAEAYDVVEEADSTAGAFGGMALASVIVMALTLIVVGSIFAGFSPSWIDTITESTTNLALFGGIMVVVGGLFALVGFFGGKAAAR